MFKIIECWYYPEKLKDIVKNNPIDRSIGYCKIINNEVVEFKGQKSNIFFMMSNPKTAVKKVEYSKVLNLVFSFDSAELNGAEKKKIDSLQQDFITHKTSILIECHTEAVGDSKFNMGLSKARAQVVADYISEKFDIDRVNITARGCGDIQQIEPNTREGNKKNNRVEFSFING